MPTPQTQQLPEGFTPIEDEANEGIDPFDAPIPGESLTADTDNKKPWEQAPELTNTDDAVQDIFLNLTEEESLDSLLDMLREGVPVDVITQVVLFRGVMAGKWNPDLMLLLIEPTIYIISALAEWADIDYTLYLEEEDDAKQWDESSIMDSIKQDIDQMSPKVLKNKIDTAIPPSLLARLPSKATK